MGHARDQALSLSNRNLIFSHVSNMELHSGRCEVSG